MTKQTYPDRVKQLAEEESELQGRLNKDEYGIHKGGHVRKSFYRCNSRQKNDARGEAYYDQNYTLLKKRVKDNNRKPKGTEKKTKKELPQYFAIKRCNDFRRPKYIKRLNEKYWSRWLWNDTDAYYWYDWSNRIFWNGWTSTQSRIGNFNNSTTILTLDEWEEMVNWVTMKEIPLTESEKKAIENRPESMKQIENEVHRTVRKHYTYSTTHVRSDGVEFTENIIKEPWYDTLTVKEAEELVKTLRSKAKKLQGLLHSHNALFPKSK